jgi:hypothetical protein
LGKLVGGWWLIARTNEVETTAATATRNNAARLVWCRFFDLQDSKKELRTYFLVGLVRDP